MIRQVNPENFINPTFANQLCGKDFGAVGGHYHEHWRSLFLHPGQECAKHPLLSAGVAVHAASDVGERFVNLIYKQHAWRVSLNQLNHLSDAVLAFTDHAAKDPTNIEAQQGEFPFTGHRLSKE